MTLRGPSDSTSCITVGRNSGDITTGCSSISDLRSGEEDGGFSSRGTASTGSVEVGVVGGEEERVPFVASCSLEGPFVSSVSFDTFIIYLQRWRGDDCKLSFPGRLDDVWWCYSEEKHKGYPKEDTANGEQMQNRDIKQKSASTTPGARGWLGQRDKSPN